MVLTCVFAAHSPARRTPRIESLGDRDVAEDVPQPNADLEGVRRAVESLPPEARELLHVKYRCDLSHRQKADLLGISPQAVHGRLKRAMQAGDLLMTVNFNGDVRFGPEHYFFSMAERKYVWLVEDDQCKVMDEILAQMTQYQGLARAILALARTAHASGQLAKAAEFLTN